MREDSASGGLHELRLSVYQQTVCPAAKRSAWIRAEGQILGKVTVPNRSFFRLHKQEFDLAPHALINKRWWMIKRQGHDLWDLNLSGTEVSVLGSSLWFPNTWHHRKHPSCHFITPCSPVGSRTPSKKLKKTSGFHIDNMGSNFLTGVFLPRLDKQRENDVCGKTTRSRGFIQWLNLSRRGKKIWPFTPTFPPKSSSESPLHILVLYGVSPLFRAGKSPALESYTRSFRTERFCCL